MTDWSYLLLASTIYALGFLGLFGISLLHLRAFLALRRNADLWRWRSGKAALLLVAVAAAIAIFFGVFSVSGVFRCLTGLHCSANRAGGWFYLATFGAWYLAFELVSTVILVVARKVTRVAT